MLLPLLSAKILVLGGSGFIGENLVHALLKQGARVRVFCKNTTKRIDHPHLEYATGDFIDGSGLDAALSGVDIVYHLISTTIPTTSNANPLLDVQENLMSTLSLLEKMRKMGMKRIVYVSSGGVVYGNPQGLPVAESHPLQPLSSYGIVKVAIENYLHLFSELYDFKTTVLRVSNPYGSCQQGFGIQGVVSTFFHKTMNGHQIEIWGDGSIVKDYIYIDDVVDALLKTIILDKTGVYNIGSGVGHSLTEVLNIVSRIIEKNPDITYLPARAFDVNKTILDISKAKQELEWAPRFTLEQGCAHYWDLIRREEKADTV